MSSCYLFEKLDENTRDILTDVGTATLSTALYKKGFRNTYIQRVSRVNTKKVQMVGQAFTLRYIPAREDLDTIDVFKDSKHPQRLAVETVPEGMVLISDCRQDASAASAGNILLTRLEVRKCAGFVSDAGIRDFDMAAQLDLPVFCAKPSAPTNLSKHHGVDIQVPIGCGGVAVYPGDVLVGDGDGVVVIPLAIATQIAKEARKMEAFEHYVLEKVRAGNKVIGLYPPNDAALLEYQQHLDR